MQACITHSANYSISCVKPIASTRYNLSVSQLKINLLSFCVMHVTSRQHYLDYHVN